MDQNIFHERRSKFLAELGDAVAVFFTSPEVLRNGDSHYPYRPDSSFYYLTGYTEEKAIAIFAPHTSTPYRLFVPPKDPSKELWVGKRMGVEEAKAQLKPNACFPLADFEKEFFPLLRKTGKVYYPMGVYREVDATMQKYMQAFSSNPRRGEKAIEGVFSTAPILARQRMVKDAHEIEIMRSSAKNSAKAHRDGMALTTVNQYEYQLAAEIERSFFLGGAQALAYPSIVGGGNNATVLHYTQNRSVLEDGDLVLVDAGGELDLYASDITRTFPVNGRFTSAQKRIYEIVLEAQKQAIAVARSGNPYDYMHKKSLEVIVDGLLDLGFLKGNQIIKEKKYKSFFPHSTGHWLGLDVHDAGVYFTDSGESIPLVPGNICTVEPGIYISKDRDDVPPEYRGIGVRIEDDILVTTGDPEVLTSGAPKEVDDLEALVGSGLGPGFMVN